MALPHVRYTAQPQLSRFTLERARYWAPSAAAWTVFTGLTAFLLITDVPLIKRDVMSKIPFYRDYWKYDPPS
ncbi:hypothetical protein BB560_005274 [Smittium megazygosporum]|uniref:Uncharacterized protein n=1 Tax=Smittium megazygosporum TaxID=133381 RepID=A0A2T9Z6W1_9FUNG|nr:hypothetical protein BB560_005274 [Smittium megazygosporum]